MNINDSEYIKGVLEIAGYTIVDNYENADIALLNTCAVRKKSEDKAYSFLGNIKKKNPKIKIGLLGCVAQKDRERAFSKSKYIDFVVGTKSFPFIDKIIEKAIKKDKKIIDLKDHFDHFDYSIVKDSTNYHAWVNIIYGCNKMCTYCIVPFTRGREKSRPLNNILKELEYKKSKGIKDITFLGQNVDSYGKDLGENANLSLLVEKTAEMGFRKIWFLTSYPSDFDDGLISVIEKYDNVTKSVHLPVQSGSDKILKAMRRGYDKEEYLEIIEKIKKTGEITISSDIIVGFPGETDEDFEETVELLKKIEYFKVNFAIYSPREGTYAWRYLKDNISREIKVKRINYLIDLQKKINLKNSEKMFGKIFNIIMESYDKKNGVMYGRTMTNRIVGIKEDLSERIGKEAKVKITKITPGPLYGEIVD